MRKRYIVGNLESLNLGWGYSKVLILCLLLKSLYWKEEVLREKYRVKNYKEIFLYLELEDLDRK